MSGEKPMFGPEEFKSNRGKEKIYKIDEYSDPKEALEKASKSIESLAEELDIDDIDRFNQTGETTLLLLDKKKENPIASYVWDEENGKWVDPYAGKEAA